MPYELTRVLNFLPAVAMDDPGTAYFRHDSTGAEAGYTAEGATKPDISPVITEQYVRPAKCAGRLIKGDMLTVPENVAQEWERSGYVERITGKS